MHNATTVFSTGLARFDGKECEMGETWVLSNLSNMFNRFNALLFKLFVICHVKEPFHAWPMSGQHECASLSLVLLVSKQPEQNTFPFLFPSIFFPLPYFSILVHFLIFL